MLRRDGSVGVGKGNAEFFLCWGVARGTAVTRVVRKK